MKLSRCFVALLLLLLPLSAQAQLFRVKPYNKVPMPQSSLYPIEAFIDEVPIPAVMKPIDAVENGGEPDAYLGRSLPQLIALFPGMTLVEDRGERVVYRTTDSLYFELYNNHVVKTFGEVKGNWKYPDEKWFIQTMQRAEASGFTRATGKQGFWKYIYKDFLFSIRYNRDTDRYSVLYEYLPSQQRFGELVPDQY